MRIAMISTGDEVLQGDITDTNAAWLSQLLNDNGMQMAWRLTVADDLNALRDAFIFASQHAELIIVNGGLGPTSDDLSAEAAGLAVNEPLVEFVEWTHTLAQRYLQRNRVMPESNRKQSMLPRSAVVIDNPVGSACGFRLCLGRSELFFTPGVPDEFKHMMESSILAVLSEKVGAVAPKITRWLTFGLSESSLSDALNPLPLPEGVSLGYRSATPSIEIKLKCASEILNEEISQLKMQIESVLGEHLFCRHNLGFAAEIQRLMLKRGLTLSLAESCTGGMLASQLVEQSGSSGYFLRGYVTYSNRAKNEDLGVPTDIIEAHGAVSEQVAVLMAAGAKRKANSDFALSVTGVAGPEGGTEAKPVGVVGFALATPEGYYSQLLKLPNRGRHFVRKLSAAVALDMLRRYLLGYPVLGEYEFITRLSGEEPCSRSVSSSI
jgi:nicotinamide-nucleotide amidase